MPDLSSVVPVLRVAATMVYELIKMWNRVGTRLLKERFVLIRVCYIGGFQDL